MPRVGQHLLRAAPVASFAACAVLAVLFVASWWAAVTIESDRLPGGRYVHVAFDSGVLWVEQATWFVETRWGVDTSLAPPSRQGRRDDCVFWFTVETGRNGYGPHGIVSIPMWAPILLTGVLPSITLVKLHRARRLYSKPRFEI